MIGREVGVCFGRLLSRRLSDFGFDTMATSWSMNDRGQSEKSCQVGQVVQVRANQMADKSTRGVCSAVQNRVRAEAVWATWTTQDHA